MDPLTYLTQHPTASRKQVMKACGCSAREVRRAEDQLGAATAAKTNRGVLALVLGGLALAATSALVLSPEQPPPPPLALRAEPQRAVEAAIYSALDARDPSRAGEVVRHLESEEEPLRLAALRYLTAVDPEPHLDRLLPLLSDSSERVRVATIQLLAKVRPQSPAAAERIGARLVAVALDDERVLAERIVALGGLRPEHLRSPEELLPALGNRRVANTASAALTRLTGRRVESKDPSVLQAAWARALKESK